MNEEDDGFDDDYSDDDDDCGVQETSAIIHISRSQIERLLSGERVDGDMVEIVCHDCCSDIIVFPTFVLDKEP